MYPFLDINRLQNALSLTIFLWRIFAGCLHVIDNEYYFIELSDKSVPSTYTENEELGQ
jgi:hypothetical protein